MSGLMTNNHMEKKIVQLEKRVLQYIRKEKEFYRKQKLVEYGHMKRTLSLMKIIEELNVEIRKLKRVHKENMHLVTTNLKVRIKELNSLYDISSLKVETNYSLDHVLQAVVDFIPSAIQYPEVACARILLDRHHFKTKNYIDTKLKLSQDIMINKEQIGTLEVCYLKTLPEAPEELFHKEARKFIASVAESIAQIIEREWAEIEIQKGRVKLERLIRRNKQ